MKRSQPFVIDVDEDDSIEMNEVIEVPDVQEVKSQIQMIDLTKTNLEPMYKILVGNYWPSNKSSDYHNAFEDSIAENAWYNPVNIDSNTAINYPHISELRVYGDKKLITPDQIQTTVNTLSTINSFRWRKKRKITTINFVGPILPYVMRNYFDTKVRGDFAITDMEVLVNAIQTREEGNVLDIQNSPVSYIIPRQTLDARIDRLKLVRKLLLPRGLKGIDKIFGNKLMRLEELNLGSSLTSVGDRAFNDCPLLSSITFSKTLKTIGENAFGRCLRLKSISLPTTVTSISTSAFANCGLDKFELSNKYCNIRMYAFINCTSLSSVKLSGTINMNYSVFEGCESLLNVDMGNAILADSLRGMVESNIFSSCTKLSAVTLPQNARTIKRGAFYECSSLQSITLPSSVTEIGYECFWGCSRLTNIVAPGLAELGASAFANCGFTSFKGTRTMTSLGRELFADCNITSIDFRESPLKYVHVHALESIPTLQSLWIPTPEDMEVTESSFTANIDGKKQTLRFSRGLNMINGVVLSIVMNTQVVTFRSMTHDIHEGDLTNLGPVVVKIEEGVTDIYVNAMDNDVTTYGVRIPHSVTYISDAAFNYCDNLTVVLASSYWEETFRMKFRECLNAILYRSDN